MEKTESDVTKPVVNDANDKKSAPKDKHKLVYIICCWLGIGMLLPWNFYYSADGYWKYKFRNPENETVTTSMQKFWGSNLSIVSMTPNFLFLFLNVIYGHRLRITPRIYGSIFFNILLFIASLVFTQINTDSWQTPFYDTTLIFALVFNMNDSIFQGAFASLIGRFPIEYMSSLAQGQAVGGTLASGISVAFLAIGGSDVNAALFSFSFAALFLATAAFVFFHASKKEFYKYFAPDEGSLKSGDVEKVDFTLIIKSTWIFNLAAFLNFFVTLGVFPSIPSLAESTSSNETWQKYFVPIGCFFVFNVCDLIGRVLAGFLKWPKATKTGSLVTLIFAIFRLAFIPLFMFCNVSPGDRHNSQVYFKSDTAYLLINTLFGLTNGYLANICMMCAPKMVKDGKNQSVAASIMVFLLVAGLWAGSAFSRLWIKLL